MSIIAINKKHQKAVNKFMKLHSKYSEIVNYNHANDIEDGNCIKQERAYDKASDCFYELNNREQSNILKAIGGGY